MHLGIRKGEILISLALALMGGCGRKTEGKSHTEAILGDLGHLTLNNDTHIRRTVGALVTSDGVQCSGFVTGTNEITTAAHCRGKDADGAKIDATFTTGDGDSVHISTVKQIETKKDYLVLTADHDFSDRLEYGPVSDDGISIVGYDFTLKNLQSQSGCKVDRKIDTAGVFLHSCDSAPGFSGGPVMQNGHVVGIHLGYQAKVDRNAALDIAKINDDRIDVATVGITDECLFDCHIRNVIPTSLPSVGDIVGGIVKSMTSQVAGAVAEQADKGGWNTANCAAVGGGAILLPAGTYIAPACAASGFITAGIGVPACVASVSGSIVAAVCVQLCSDHHLSDCK